MNIPLLESSGNVAHSNGILYSTNSPSHTHMLCFLIVRLILLFECYIIVFYSLHINIERERLTPAICGHLLLFDAGT
jgi:hypothetical protein